MLSSFYYESYREYRNGGNELSNVRSFIISREGVTSFNTDNSAIFSNEKKKYNEAFREVYILRIREINFKSNLVLVVVLDLESKGLY